MSKQVTVAGNVYNIERMPARMQFHVLRRIAPVLTGLLPALDVMDVLKSRDASPEDMAGAMLNLLRPMTEVLANLSDQDMDYVINGCLAYVRRLDGERQAPIMATDGRQFMYPDITAPVMVQLTVESIKENMGNFFDLLPELLGPPAATGVVSVPGLSSSG